MLDSLLMIPVPRARTRPSESIWTWAAAILLAAFFLATSLFIASRRLFWFDEILTVLFARSPSVHSLWQALLGGGDQSPFPFFLAVRASEWIFGRGELAARIPSAVALAVGLLLTFDCTRRFTNGLYGLMAQALLTCSFLPFYGYEARPYGLFFMFSALLLWFWLRVGETSKRAAVAFGALVCAATMVHFYLIFCLIPYATYELLQWRRPSLKLIAGAIGEGLGLALLSPQLLAGRGVVMHGSWWIRPNLANLEDIFGKFFPYGLFLLALVMLLTAVVNPRKSLAPLPMPDAERLGWFFLLIPFAGYVVAIAVTKSFLDRYFIGALPGVAVALASLLHRHFGEKRFISGAILIFFTAIGVAHQASKVRNPELIQSYGDQQRDTKQLIQWENTFNQEGKRYTAVHRGRLVWLEAWYYSKHPERYYAISEPGTACWTLQSAFPTVQCWTPDDLKRHARETAVVLSDLGNLQDLKDAGFTVSVRAGYPVEIFYLE
jgi:hypothetical protein